MKNKLGLFQILFYGTFALFAAAAVLDASINKVVAAKKSVGEWL